MTLLSAARVLPGRVVARRLAESPNISVLLLEAGGGDDIPSVREASLWPSNLETDRQWNFRAHPTRLNGRAIPLNMGRVLGGGSSVNAMIWARGHRNDWDYFAAQSSDDAWNYDSVLATYRRIEDWCGAPDFTCRGTGGLLFIQPSPDPNPIAPAMVEGAGSLGIEMFDDAMGLMMEASAARMAVVDHELKVHDIENLRIADGSIMPRVTTGNTMAPCVIIGERVAEVPLARHKLETSVTNS
jgi:choline dehydrogenase